MDKVHKRVVILILLLGIITYANSFANPFIWDDHGLISNNFLIKSWRNIPKLFTSNLFYGSGSKSNFYRPLQSLSFTLDYSLWGLAPFGYHLTNLIFHSIVALLFYRLAFFLLKDKTIAFVAAALFIVHPLHVEAVTYVSGRADPLVALFLLLSLILFTKSLIFGSLAVFCVALLAKESALIFPFILILYQFCFSSTTKMKKSISLFFLLALIYIFLRLTLLCPISINISSEYPFFTRLFFSIKAVGLYLSLLIFPFNLHMSYSVILHRVFFDAQILIPFALIIFIIWGLIRAYLQGAKVIFFAGGWFFLFLLPYSRIFPLNAFFAEHFVYLASMGFFLIVAIVSVKLSRKSMKIAFISLPPQLSGFLRGSLLGLILFFFAFLSFRYNSTWQDPAMFYQRIIRLSPNSFAAYNNLGVIFEERGLLDKARRMYELAIGIKPDFSEAYINHGRLDHKEGLNQKAIERYREALRIDPENSSGYRHLGNLYFSREEFGPAIEAYSESLRLDPYSIKTRNSLGIAYKKMKQYLAAIKEYKLILKLAPRAIEIYNNLGVAYSKNGDYVQAQEALEKALLLNPKYANASYNLAILYWEQGRRDEMIQQLRLTLEINPQHSKALEQLTKISAQED